jgi:hypothetical protein
MSRTIDPLMTMINRVLEATARRNPAGDGIVRFP